MTLSLLKRTFDAARFNEVANHPDVRPWLGGNDGPIDLTPLVNNPDNVSFIGEHGGFICHNIGSGRYEVHSMVLPEGRGKNTVEAVREGMRFMFCATDCAELVTKCPDNNGAAIGIARATGFRKSFRREACWPHDGSLVGVAHCVLSLDDWVGIDPVVKETGEWLHERFEQIKAEHAIVAPPHPEDEAHDRMSGASVLMFRLGNPRKAVRAYNRWAAFAGYAPIILHSEMPLVVEMREREMQLWVTISGHDMEVLLCR